jgi:hypothetical protein
MKVSPETICKAWKEFTDTALKPDVVRAHLESLSEWTNSEPKTIRRMSAEQLANFRQETIEALLANGVAKERAEELVSGLIARAREIVTAGANTADILVVGGAGPNLSLGGEPNRQSTAGAGLTRYICLYCRRKHPTMMSWQCPVPDNVNCLNYFVTPDDYRVKNSSMFANQIPADESEIESKRIKPESNRDSDSVDPTDGTTVGQQ